jgi:hypothetical protein
MNINVITGGIGSSKDAVTELKKGNQSLDSSVKRKLFDQEIESVSAADAIKNFDNNNAKLSINDTKFYQLIISPFEKELKHIKCKEDALIEYTRKVMDVYAENFDKGIKGADLLYVAKIEEFRIDTTTKENKPGLNWHINVLVSRKDKSQTAKLSPLPSHRKGGNGPKKIDFDRNNFLQSCEDAFDQLFKFPRLTVDSFEYLHIIKNNKSASKKAMAKKYLSANPKKVLGKLTELLKSTEPVKTPKKKKDDIDPSI